VIDFERRGAVAVITIRRPEVRNAVDRTVAEGIERAVDRLESNDELFVGILAAEGPVFCAGADLAAVAAGDTDGIFTARGGFAGLVRRTRTKPLIAAVEGPALAGGLELVLACDLVVGSRNATFGLPEVKRSLVASGGGLFRLPQAVGAKVGQEMILTGDPIDAERAHRLGLVNRLVDAGAALDEALALATRIASNAPLAVRESMRVANLAFSTSETELWRQTGEASARVVRSEDFVEGPRAFVAKRTPVWQGR
jgi:enoyl-CoA hydratase